MSQKYKHQKPVEINSNKIIMGAATVGFVALTGQGYADTLAPAPTATANKLDNQKAATPTAANSVAAAMNTVVAKASDAIASSAASSVAQASDTSLVASSVASESAGTSSASSEVSETSSAASSASSTVSNSSSAAPSSAPSHSEAPAASSGNNVSSNIQSSAATQPAAQAPAATPAPVAPVAPVYAAPMTNYEANTISADYQAPKALESVDTMSPISKIDSATVQSFIDSIAKRVRILAGKNNLYASIIIAQAILESGHGTSSLSANNFNLFGIKGSYMGRFIGLPTFEYDAQGNMYQVNQNFRFYSNYDQSLDDYINLMLKGTTWNEKIYEGSWKTKAKNYEAAANSLIGVYATDPNYAKLLVQIIQEYHLDQYDDVDANTKIINTSAPASPIASTSDFAAFSNQDYAGAEGYAFGNCTRYVFNRVSQFGGILPSNLGNGGDWGVNAQAQGYYVTTTAQKGYAISFPPGVASSDPTYGHVAFVEKVNEDGSVLISEMNATAGFNAIDYRTISAGDAALATYIQPKK